ncbi:hypothetical protein M0R88_05755 [Halorussus gelatinilyticus]|uniref:DUF8134 domain-containing protein n=1 Tax=Halorussus gelatinilyticus TaxID=2937524 RepID=A0A8U0ILG3_9EURY|nr:hypothetical protein [Halorussus gelatinilyticus]UPW01608.1 hypothetical protein M0R88_05755 [Halorussus gelatinilyticus]
MVVSIHQLDDGAWLSVNDSRSVPVSELWLLARHDFCDCEPADFLAEGFVEVGVDWPDVEGRIAGQCVQCGASGVTGWLALGRVERESEEFHRVDPSSVHVPERRTRLATPSE